MDAERASQAIFGSFDGMVSVLGVIVALTVSPTLIPAALGLAVASAVGMGAGEYLSDNGRSVGAAGMMAGATLVGTLSPVLPVVLGAPWWSAIPVVLALAALVARQNALTRGPRAWAETYLLLAIAAGATVALTLATGAS